MIRCASGGPARALLLACVRFTQFFPPYWSAQTCSHYKIANFVAPNMLASIDRQRQSPYADTSVRDFAKNL